MLLRCGDSTKAESRGEGLPGLWGNRPVSLVTCPMPHAYNLVLGKAGDLPKGWGEPALPLPALVSPGVNAGPTLVSAIGPLWPCLFQAGCILGYVLAGNQNPLEPMPLSCSCIPRPRAIPSFSCVLGPISPSRGPIVATLPLPSVACASLCARECRVCPQLHSHLCWYRGHTGSSWDLVMALRL